MDKLVYLIYPVMILVIAGGARICAAGKWNEEFMSLRQTKYIQGFLAVCIMLHHIAQETCGSWQEYPLIHGLDFFVRLGYLFVAVFMMCSGYGLYKSYVSKENYFGGFIKKRVLPIIFAFYTTGLLYLIARIILGEKMTPMKLLWYVTGISQPSSYSWYVITLPIFYLLFYLCFKMFKSDGMRIGGVVLGTFVYTLIGTCINHNDYLMRGEWWYNSVHLFWIGIILAKYEKSILVSVKKKYPLYFAAVLVGMVFFFRLGETLADMGYYYGETNYSLSFREVVRNRWIVLAAQMMASLNFVLWVLLLNLKIKIGNRFLGFMGRITLEFYLLHGLILELFSYQFFDTVPSLVRITNVALLIVVVFVPSVLLALGEKKLTDVVFKRR